MSQKELSRYHIIQKLVHKELIEKEAASLIHLYVRQIRRLKKKVIEHGPQGLIHGNRGKPSHNRIPKKEQQRIIKLLHEHYPDFKPTHAQEKLKNCHGLDRDPKTIRQIMIAEGLWKPRRKKNQSEHREWRQRKAHFGEMVQFDGSYEYWFEDRGAYCCLLLAVDDASGALLHGRFDKDEGVFPVFGFWREYLLKYGKPMNIYLDRFSTYKMTQKVAQNNHDLKTQFERATRELQIETIFAHSPEAKGRVERRFGTLQDRLIKEMRLKNISTMAEANHYLEQEFIPWFNARYAIEPRGKANLHKSLSASEQKQLENIFSKQMERVVQNDFTISYGNQWYQLTKDQPVTVCKRDKIIIEEHIDGSVHFRLRGKYLNAKPLPERLPYSHRPKMWILPAAPQKIRSVTQQMIREIKPETGHFNFPRNRTF
jgi:hypothetical protein